MFLQNKCSVPGCNHISLSSFNENGEIQELRTYCLDHIPNPGKAKDDICRYIQEHDTIVGLNASWLNFSDMDFTGKKFYGCDFSHCTFTNIQGPEFRSRLSIFDYAGFSDCQFLNSHIMFSSFSGCNLYHTILTSSEIIQTNFNGLKAFQCSFDDSDLFNSRFIRASLTDTSFRNCNLKKVDFIEIERINVSFKMSNTREAVFNRDGSALFTGEEAEE